jgi:hypothetical protein
LEICRIDAIGNHRDPPQREPEHGRDVCLHEVGARDHLIGAANHRLLDRMDV